MSIPPSTLHLHDEDCRVPLARLFSRLAPGDKPNNFSYYIESRDGRDFIRLNGRYALEGCSFKKIPIFLPSKPEGL